MLGAEHDEPVQALDCQGLDEALGEDAEVGRLVLQPLGQDPVPHQLPVERIPELAVPVPDEHPRPPRGAWWPPRTPQPAGSSGFRRVGFAGRCFQMNE